MSASQNKRQRTSGSFSPASPPYHLAKPPTEETKTPVVHPRTPTSPPYMSSAPPSYAYSTTSPTFQQMELSPPLSAAMASQNSQQPVVTAATSFPTPADSITDNALSTIRDGDGDAQMQDTPVDDGTKASGEDTEMTDLRDHRHSNHDRQGVSTSASGRRVGLERLDADLGSLYKLCEKPHPVARPHGAQNLIALYGLEQIAASVARKDPVTGEKINKLRKSYEGQIKRLQIGGKNKAVVEEGQFMNMLIYPDFEWHVQKVQGKEMTNPSALLSKLDRALQMGSGKLPPSEDAKWKGIIAQEEAPKPKPLVDAKKGAVGQVGGRASPAPSPLIKPSRPERTGTKRRYDDASYEGYEGYGDDAATESAGGEDERWGGGAKKKRRKEYGQAGSPLAGNYNAPPVGVRR
ncbi:hypothetical protein W97_00567 [Coniosporium apollinis CBS 100218]|uniref:Mediator of RNA polymerase II transcription subunit 19 n=1 Tax=Coniosporium apollinis (strain CBS 100218) TaxID=1168221 RepID=R7YHI0_CONA1|nr:uncharacterized protein W97_00567 [Coniosporium apollinis CBS 100218]EON61353.1 hypothetical protein W97_00567 [Coniosporium apollinis CBS 100218]